MKTNKMIAAVATLAMVVGFSACKPKQSAYKAAYDRAKQREVVQVEEETVEPITDSSAVRSEKVSPAADENANNLRAYSVVIGSFQNLTNARSLKERMMGEGFANAMLAMNEKGMYRVIITSFETKAEAVRSREEIKARFAPLFSDAWILERMY